MRGKLWLNGWHGLTGQEVEVLGETPKRIRIRALEETRLAGRNRVLYPGETALVPKYAVTTDNDPDVAERSQCQASSSRSRGTSSTVRSGRRRR